MSENHVPKYLPCVSIDCTVLGFSEGKLQVLLIARNKEPKKGAWGLPGGLIQENEDLDSAAKRILESATGISDVYMDQLRAFGSVARFPGKRIITIGYTALIKPENYALRPGAIVQDVKWADISPELNLIFDHNQILEDSLGYLKRQVQQYPIGFELLPQKFTMPEILSLYEAILGKDLDRRNFSKKLLKMRTIKRLNEKRKSEGRRAAQLYQFDKEIYERYQQDPKSYNFSRL